MHIEDDQSHINERFLSYFSKRDEADLVASVLLEAKEPVSREGLRTLANKRVSRTEDFSISSKRKIKNKLSLLVGEMFLFTVHKSLICGIPHADFIIKLLLD